MKIKEDSLVVKKNHQYEYQIEQKKSRYAEQRAKENDTMENCVEP